MLDLLRRDPTVRALPRWLVVAVLFASFFAGTSVYELIPPVALVPQWPGGLWTHFKNLVGHRPTWRGILYLFLLNKWYFDEIYDFLVARYGEFALYRPRMSGKTLVLWISPILLLLAGGFAKVDYVEVRDAESLEPWPGPTRPGRVLAAAWLGKTRLIDNIEIAR